MNRSELGILIVDDCQEDRELFRRHLTKHSKQSYRIFEAETSLEGWKICRTEHPDCILLDFKLPDINGLEFIASLRKHKELQFVPIIMLTGQGDESIASTALKGGAADYIVKGTISSEGLYRAISTAIEKATLLRTNEAQRLEIERSQKELEQFAYTASHDLQAPVRRIINFLELLEKDLREDISERSRDYLHRAKKSALLMREFIQDLLSYSRVGGSPELFQSVDLQNLVQELLGELDVLIQEASAEFVVGELPTILGNPTFLKQLFQNLIGNALKFRSDKPPIVEITTSLSNAKWHFAVRDNGIGIPTDSHEKIFGMFQRLNSHSKFEGTGIGLALCKKIVEFHGGRIWVESVEQQGTTFHFTLPKMETSDQDSARSHLDQTQTRQQELPTSQTVN